MLVIKDFATTTIASALTAAATSIVVSDASRLPALSAGDHFDLVLQKFTDRNYVEVVRVTGVSGNTLTVARGRDGTMGRAFSIGDYAEVRLTVGVFSTYVSQLVEGKVDKDFSYVNQRLQVVNTGDLVGASLALLYAAGTGHGTIVSGGEGVNKQTPYVALRPLGHANAATQLKYTDEGSLSLVGGTRSASFGFLLSEHSFDSDGFPNAVSNDANNYINRARSKITAGNSGLHFLADAALNARRFGIQAGHSLASEATSHGILDLNPFGGLVRVNGGTVYHTGYMPTPAALGALALSGGTLTGILSQNMAGYGVRFLASGGSVYLQGGKVDSSADQKMVLSGFNGVPLTNFNILTAAHGLATINSARIYTEEYVPTPAVIGAVPQARTINTKPLTSNVVLSAADVGAVPQARTINSKPLMSDIVLDYADVGAAPAGYGLGGYAASIPSNDLNTGLRTASGFYTGSLAANRPAWPMSGAYTWDYVFNIAHSHLAGYNGMIAIDFNGKGLAFKTITGGADMGWKYVYHSDYLPPATVGSAPNPIELGGTEHLDNLKAPNIYSQSADANTSISRGYPEALAGALHVYRGAGVTQVYYVYNSSRVWTRSFYSGFWTSWASQYNSQNPPTPAGIGAVPQARTINSKPLTANITLSAADVGALPVTGGTVSGVLGVTAELYLVGPSASDMADIVWKAPDGTERGRLWIGGALGADNSLTWRSGASGGWHKIYHEGNKPTASDVGAVKQGDRFVASGAYGNDFDQCAIEVNGNTAIDSRPGIGFHMAGRFASTLHLWEGGDFRFHAQGLTSYAGIMTGNVNANDVYIRSDRRLKKNLVEVRDALRKVSSLTAYSYDKKQTLEATEYDKKEVGLIAQDVEQVLPEAVTRVVDSSNKDGTEILTLSNSALIALLVEAVKELSEKVKELEHGRT